MLPKVSRLTEGRTVYGNDNIKELKTAVTSVSAYLTGHDGSCTWHYFSLYRSVRNAFSVHSEVSTPVLCLVRLQTECCAWNDLHLRAGDVRSSREPQKDLK